MAYFVTPVTILTGFLGSGKTTLLNRFLKEAGDKRFAVIENEFGEVSIDDDLVYRDVAETIVQLANGCLCCRVRGDLARALGDLAARRDAGELSFDHVLIETSGMADPRPVIQTFLAETALLTHYALDGVVAVVDAVNVHKILGEAAEAVAQIALADRVLLTKTDIVDDRRRQEAEQAVKAINGLAPLTALDLNSVQCEATLAELLDVRGYELNRVTLADHPLGARLQRSALAPAIHTRDVSAVAYRTVRPLDARKIQEAFAKLRDAFGDRIWRMKGILAIAGYPKRIVVQGVQEFLAVNDGLVWRPFEQRETKLVVIGPGLEKEGILRVLADCELPDQAPPTTDFRRGRERERAH